MRGLPGDSEHGIGIGIGCIGSNRKVVTGNLHLRTSPVLATIHPCTPPHASPVEEAKQRRFLVLSEDRGVRLVGLAAAGGGPARRGSAARWLPSLAPCTTPVPVGLPPHIATRCPLGPRPQGRHPNRRGLPCLPLPSVPAPVSPACHGCCVRHSLDHWAYCSVSPIESCSWPNHRVMTTESNNHNSTVRKTVKSHFTTSPFLVENSSCKMQLKLISLSILRRVL